MARTILWRLVASLPVVAMGLVVPGAAYAEPRHPHMHRALFELRETQKELKEAAHDFGGHREDALRAVDAAIVQLDAALEADGDRYKGYTGEKDVYRNYDYHPHMHQAIRELKETRTNLRDAKHDYGGHREAALKEVDNAIEQLQVALKFARK